MHTVMAGGHTTCMAKKHNYMPSPNRGPCTRRVANILGHVAPKTDAEDDRTPQLAAAPAMGMQALTGILPMVAMGAYFLFQQRGKGKEEKRELSELELVAEELGFDAERLDALGDWATKLIKKKQLPGVVLAVARKGQLVYHEAFGDRTFQRDSIMSIQSMALPIITATLMSFVDEGLISVDDDITKYIPAFSKFCVYRSGTTKDTLETDPIGITMKVKHVLTNTWGFPGYFYMQSRNPDIRLLDVMAEDANPTIGVDADFENLASIPLLDQPGRRYRVGMTTSVIDHIICKITGRSLPDVVQERIFEPLRMVDTHWYVPSEKQHRVATMHDAVPWLTVRPAPPPLIPRRAGLSAPHQTAHTKCACARARRAPCRGRQNTLGITPG